MNRLKKHISTLLICSIFLFSQSRYAEANPAVIVLGTVAVGAAIITAAGVQYYKPDGAAVTTAYNTYVDAAGSVYRIANATWNAVNQYNQAVIANKLISFKIGLADIIAFIGPYDGSHPALEKIFFEDDSDLGEITKTRNVGETVTVTSPVCGSSPSYKITYKYASSMGAGNWPPSAYFSGWTPTITDGSGAYFKSNKALFITTAGQGQPWDFVEFNFTPDGALPVRNLAPLTNIVPELNLDGSKNSVYNPALTAEIDNLIRQNPAAASPVDTATPDTDTDAPPALFPPTVVVPNASPTTLPSITANNNATTKQQQLTTAQDAVTQYQAAHPDSTVANDPTLADLVAARNAAQSQADAATNLADTLAAEESVAVPSPTTDALKAIDFSPFLTLNGVLANKFPFTLLTSIESSLVMFLGSGTAPIFTIPITSTNTLTIDLTILDPVATVCRYTLALLISIGTVFIIVRRYTD